MRRLRDEDGQTVVEFVLMLPFIFLMVFVIVEFGFALYTQVTVRNAASEAARYAAVGNLSSASPGTCDAGSIEERARNTSNNLVECDAVTVFYQAPVNGIYTRGSGVSVRVQHEYQTVTPLPALANFISGGALPTTWTLGACSDSRLETRLAVQTAPRVQAGSDCS